MNPEVNKKLESVGTQVKALIEIGNNIEISDEAGHNYAVSFLGELKGEIKSIEEARKELVKPLNDHVKKINDQFKIRTVPLLQIEKFVKSAIGEYITKLEKIAEEKRREAEKERLENERIAREREEKARAALEDASNDHDEEVAAEAVNIARDEVKQAQEVVKVEEPARTTRVANATSSVQKVWKFEIIDESQLIRQFLTPDTKEIRKFVADGGRETPGVRIYQENLINIRNK